YLKLYARMLGREIGVEFDIMPYKGAAPLVAALKEGKIAAGIGSVSPLLEHKNLELPEWYGFFAASATPPAIAAEWSRQLQPILREPETVAQLAVFGLDARPTTQEE